MNHLTLLCQIVDNLGDAGVALRLARQWLQRNTTDRITLLTDCQRPFDRLIGAQPRPERLQILETLDPPDPFEWGNIIIELFGTPLPTRAKQQLAQRPAQPVWINLEYLSAEDWVEHYHGHYSTDPATGWQQLFFFPGFTAQTGGLMGPETDTHSTQFKHKTAPDTLQPDARSKPGADKLILNAYMLAYTLQPLRQLHGLSMQGERLVFHADDHIEGTRSKDTSTNNATTLQCHIADASTDTLPVFAYTPVPFVEQIAFDALLGQYDVLFVRGEDSFVRAQLSGKPLVWQIYPTEDGAHWVKLDAFFTRYTQGMTNCARSAFWTLWLWWNGHPSIDAAQGHRIICAALAQWSAICANAATWQAHIVSQCTLLERLQTAIEHTRERLNNR